MAEPTQLRVETHSSKLAPVKEEDLVLSEEEKNGGI